MSLVVNPGFLDVDFRTFPQYVMGTIEPSSQAMQAYMNTATAYEDVVQLIPKSDWESLANDTQQAKSGLEYLITMILNQGREGSCVGNAETAGVMLRWNFQFGIALAKALSAISAYKLIGSSPMSGAMVADALEAGKQVGILPLDTPENIQQFGADGCMPATGFYTRFPAKHKETAKNFRIDEYNVIRTFEGMVTALLRGEPVIVGRNGHSILYVGMLFIDGKIYFLYVNSWGKWGMAAGNFGYGFGLDSEKVGRQSARWCFSIRSVLTPSWVLAA